jgi:hypothetical protein
MGDWVGFGDTTVESDVVLRGCTKLELGRSDGLEVMVMAVVRGAEDVLIMEVVELLLMIDEVDVVEAEVDVVDGGTVELLELLVEVEVGAGVCETRPPVTLYAAAQAVRSMPSGQHHVSPSLSDVQ